METILITGATGYVGNMLYPALARRGPVRCLSRDVDRARAKWPGRLWLAGNVGDLAACVRALDGCSAAFYLVHSIGENRDFRRREREAALRFAEAAGCAGVRRLVYLGGVAPSGPASEHLQSRLEVGDALRSGPVPTVELRASMIIGHGSVSWLIVRDLAARLPAMLLPRWLRSRTEPVAIDDVVMALLGALDLHLEASAWFDIPGPDVLSAEQILIETARAMGRRAPVRLSVPVLTPELSAYWIRFVTRARWSVAHELVLGLESDLLAHDDRFWSLIGHEGRLPFREAAKRAFEAERQAAQPVTGAWGAIERALALRTRPA